MPSSQEIQMGFTWDSHGIHMRFHIFSCLSLSVHWSYLKTIETYLILFDFEFSACSGFARRWPWTSADCCSSRCTLRWAVIQTMCPGGLSFLSCVHQCGMVLVSTLKVNMFLPYLKQRQCTKADYNQTIDSYTQCNTHWGGCMLMYVRMYIKNQGP